MKANAETASGWRMRIFIAFLSISIAILIERLNSSYLKLLTLYPGMTTAGWIITLVLSCLTAIVVVKNADVARKKLTALISCIVLPACFFAYDRFLSSGIFPTIERKNVESLLVVLYGVSFASVCWLVFGLLTAGVQNLPHGTSRFEFVKQTSSPLIVIFVHGWTGEASGTWGKFPTLLADDPDLREIDVCVWGYPSNILGRMPSIAEAASQLQTELRVRLAEYRSVVLIGHSLGGLLIRSLIVRALESARIEDIDRVAHIVTFATPNEGSQIAGILAALRIPNRQLKDLAIAGETVSELRNAWVNRVYNPEIRPGEERIKRKIPLTAVSGLLDGIVTSASATGFFQNPPPETVEGNHITMKLPDSRAATCYLLVKKILTPLIRRQ